MSPRIRSLAVLALAAVALVAGAGGWQAAAQIIPPILTTTTTAPQQTTTTRPIIPRTTTTTAPGQTTTTTAPPPGGGGTPPPPTQPPAGGQPPPPPGASDDPAQGTDGGAPPIQGWGGLIPAEAQAVIDSVVRSAPSNNAALVEGAQALATLGVPQDQAVRAAFGRFPLAGSARWSDDWLYPRWTGTLFRYHQGCDVFAAYGTPVRAPVDGVARIGTNSLGGNTVSVVQPDGTYFYFAHLSGYAPGLVQSQPLRTGDLIGFVGDSGNAKGGQPHTHIGYYPQGGQAAPPKPLLDQFVADAAARLPALLATHQAGQSRALVATGLLRRLADQPGSQAAPTGPSRTALLWASSANPAGGGLQLAEARAAQAAESIDWAQRAALQLSYEQALRQATERAWRYLAPLTPKAIVQAMNRR